MTSRPVGVFALAGDARPQKVFYTLTAADVGMVSIETTAGTIHLQDDLNFGRVQRYDVGKRAYGELGIPGYAGYFWEIENDQQRDQRVARERED